MLVSHKYIVFIDSRFGTTVKNNTITAILKRNMSYLRELNEGKKYLRIAFKNLDNNPIIPKLFPGKSISRPLERMK